MAQSLFDEARKLMAEGDYARACPKFAESERLDPGGGTLLNLALCHEGQGMTASAWTEFNEALSRAIRDGRPEREARARERIAVLGPKLSRLKVIVPDGSPPDLELTVDGASWGTAMRGAAVPLDPGPHVIVARAAGASPWTTTVTLGANADARTVRVTPFGSSVAPTRALAAGQPVGSPAPADGTPGGGGDGRRTAGWIVGGLGGVALGVGTAFGILALSKRSDSNRYCQPGCTQQGVDLNNQAITAAWVSDFGVGLGVLGVAVGVYLLVTSHGDTPSRTSHGAMHIVPEALERGGGAAFLVDWR